MFAKSIAKVFAISLSTSTVPTQWKQAIIRPVNKIPIPKSEADYRPISITPVLSRLMERLVVRNYIYPAFLSPPPSLSFSGPIRLQAHRIHYRSCHLSFQQSDEAAGHQLLRHRLWTGQAICTQRTRRDPSNPRLNEHGIYIRHCQESNSQPVPSQAGADTTRPQ